MNADLLHYRPWRGHFKPSTASIWPIARIAVWMVLRRKMFWGLYALALSIFLMFFFGQYLLAWAETQTAETSVNVGLIRTEPSRLIGLLRDVLKLNGRAETYRNFFWWQGYMVMILLALAGSILVGSDFHFGTLPFYFSKPLRRWHYIAGKCLAVAFFVNLMTTVPALALFVQYGLLDSWEYFLRDGWTLGHVAWGDSLLSVRLPNPLLFGIVGYGLALSVCLSLILVAAASWLQRTVPLIMVWTTLFFFLRLLAGALVDGLQYGPRWRLLDLWNDTYIVGSACLGMGMESFRSPNQPSLAEALFVLGGICTLCLIYLNRRIRAVEIVR
jgi:ABC-2 type transport system permease protein